MKRSSWLITILFIIAFFVIEHRTIPNVPLPQHYTLSGTRLTIPVSMSVPKANTETWTLSRTSDGSHYFVGVVSNQKFIRSFSSTKKLTATSTGTEYGGSGQIRINGVLFDVDTIHVNPDGRSGQVVLVEHQASSGTSNAVGTRTK